MDEPVLAAGKEEQRVRALTNSIVRAFPDHERPRDLALQLLRDYDLGGAYRDRAVRMIEFIVLWRVTNG